VTTDKCYENDDSGRPFVESDPMGGVEPYGSSKACSELVTRAMTHSFYDPSRHAEHGVAIATARAGNVVGGGDWGENRLLPDMMRAFAAGEPVLIRRPASTRPWQHVLDPLRGYLLLAQALVENGPAYGGGWNFGPEVAGARPVSWVVERCVGLWGTGASWRQDANPHPAEAELLQLNCSRARDMLGWRQCLSLDRTLELTVEWYRRVTMEDADAAHAANRRERASAKPTAATTGDEDGTEEDDRTQPTTARATKRAGNRTQQRDTETAATERRPGDANA